MAAVTLKWPEVFGFRIVGDGPSFVVSVERGSIAHAANIRPGDQVLELDGHNVADMSAEAIKKLAKHSRTVPPTVGVVSRLQYIELAAIKRWGYGLTLAGRSPVTVQSVEPLGPAYQAGIRRGDFVLEVNGRKVHSAENVNPILNSHIGKITLAVIPMDRLATPAPSSTPGEGSSNNGQQFTRNQGSRVRKARDLHAKMDRYLGGDHEKKLTIVSGLKQYAEDRNIDKFIVTLSLVLHPTQHHRLLRDIRSYIPVKHRHKFDVAFGNDALATNSQASNSQFSSVLSSAQPPYYADKRIVTIRRAGGSFGFILRGHDPVVVEAVDPGGPADKAGLMPGDAILKLNGLDVSKSGHAHLIRLLQGSGHAPTLEIIQPVEENGMSPFSTDTLLSSESSVSSHASSGWMSEVGPQSEAQLKAFKERVDNLLTGRERSSLKKALLHYTSDRNVAELIAQTDAILDTPSKRTLWVYLLSRFSPDHQKFIVKSLDLPEALLDNDQSTLGGSTRQHSNPLPHHSGSFRRQLDYLLTPRERSQLKQALQNYSERRHVQHLLEDISEILDTPSKRTLWFYIIPLLSASDQAYCQRKLGLPDVDGNPLGGAAGYTRESDDCESTSSTEYGSYSGKKSQKVVRRKSTQGSYDITGPETRESIETATRLHLTKLTDVQQNFNGLHGIYKKTKDENNKLLQDFTAGVYIKETPVLEKMPIVKVLRDSAAQTTPEHLRKQWLNIRNSESNSEIQYTPENRTIVHIHSSVASYRDQTEVRDAGDGSSFELKKTVPMIQTGAQVGIVAASSAKFQNSLKPRDKLNGFTSDKDTETGTLKYSVKSDDSFSMQAHNAIKALEDVVANEVTSDIENVAALPPRTLPPPPPPAPPPPPPPPLKALGSVDSEDGLATDMHVKRINWEKLDVVDKNSLWAQVGNHMTESEDLEDVVKYLELEQQFSTKRSKASESFNEKSKSIVCILAPKKAYNISILLGHLRLPVSSIKQSLYLMDEDVLTPELLRQMLAYAPDENEKEQYDKYKDDINNLSKPDQFMYQMNEVPGFEQRLQAMLFKANFAEKVEEVRYCLKSIKKASEELMQSKKLAKILEVVLAMGNYMNKGNARVGQAAGFRISFLSHLELTKTSDNKSTFLHVLADAVYTKFPDMVNLKEDLTMIHEAAKVTSAVSNTVINQELADLRKVLQEISTTVNELSGIQQNKPENTDRFQDVMGHFISQASDEIQSLFSFHASTIQDFNAMVQYFGEDHKKVKASEIFDIFSQFVTKFEKAHHYNILYKRH